MRTILVKERKQDRILKILLQVLLGIGVEYIWKELDKISNILSEDTEEKLIYNMPNMKDEGQFSINGRKFDWSKLYGKLGERRIRICFI